MYPSIRRILLLAALLTALVNPAQAALLYGHLHPDLVLDTETGLIWMPADATAAELATYAAFGGNQRVAGGSDVRGLFADEFGLLFGGVGWIDQGAFESLLTFLNFLRLPDSNPVGLCQASDCMTVAAAYSDGPALPLPAPREVVAFQLFSVELGEDGGEFFGGTTSTLGGWSIPDCAGDPGGFGCDDASTWLVMSAVPVPAAIWLLLSGCLALVGIRVRRPAGGAARRRWRSQNVPFRD